MGIIGKGLRLYQQDFNSWFNDKAVKVNRKNTLEQINELAISRFNRMYNDCNKFQQQYLRKQYVKLSVVWMSLPICDTKEEVMDSIIECNCLDCPEFKGDLLTSECICESICDIAERNGIDYESIGHLFESIRLRYLKEL